MAGLLLAAAGWAAPDAKPVLPAAMQTAVADFRACVRKDGRALLPLSDELVRQPNLCGVYLAYDAAKLKWFKSCLRTATPVFHDADGRRGADARSKTSMVWLRCSAQPPDLSLDLLQTEHGLVVNGVHEIVP